MAQNTVQQQEAANGNGHSRKGKGKIITEAAACQGSNEVVRDLTELVICRERLSFVVPVICEEANKMTGEHNRVMTAKFKRYEKTRTERQNLTKKNFQTEKKLYLEAPMHLGCSASASGRPKCKCCRIKWEWSTGRQCGCNSPAEHHGELKVASPWKGAREAPFSIRSQR